jgi:hypothetical protein
VKILLDSDRPSHGRAWHKRSALNPLLVMWGFRVSNPTFSEQVRSLAAGMVLHLISVIPTEAKRAEALLFPLSSF